MELVRIELTTYSASMNYAPFTLQFLNNIAVLGVKPSS